MLPRETLDFQNLRSTILGHSGRNFVPLQTHLLEFIVAIKAIILQRSFSVYTQLDKIKKPPTVVN